MEFDPEKEILPGQEWFVRREWQSSVHALASCLIPWTGAGICSGSGGISWATGGRGAWGALGKAEASAWEGAGVVSVKFEASG
jgi:hypothetical protein